MLLLGGFGVTNTLAADDPGKPIEIIVPYAPGGSTDTSARISAPKASKSLGQPIVVINKPGAGGALGYDQVVKSAPGGYTLVLYAINAVILKAINSSLSFHPVQDFAPVSNLITQANILIVSPNSKITSVAQYVEAAKKSPGKVTLGSSGMGSSQHLSGELFKRVAKVDRVHVPHKGSAPCVTVLLGGHIESGFINAPDVMEQVRGGKLRAIGVTTAQQIVELPKVPTIAQSGYPGFEVVSWMGICAPGTPPRPIVEKLANAYKQAMEDPEVSGKMKTMGFIPIIMGVFGVAEILINLESCLQGRKDIYEKRITGLLPSMRDWAFSTGAILRGSVVGFFLGTLPGGGAVLGSFASYRIGKKVPRNSAGAPFMGWPGRRRPTRPPRKGLSFPS